MTASVAKIVLTTQSLRWSSPIIFNDPFDVTQELRLDFDEEQLSRALAHEIARMIENGDTSIGHPVMAALLTIFARSDQTTRFRMAQEFRDDPPTVTQGQLDSMELLREKWRNIVPTLRVLCLSERYDVTSMWNHYADHYRGVVLEFEAVDEIDSAFLCARCVEYQDAPPRIASLEEWVSCLISHDQSRYFELFTEYQYTKTNDWSNEKEWRIVSGMRLGESGSYSDRPFHPRELTGIYFGPQMQAQDRADIQDLLGFGQEHVQAYESTVDLSAGRFQFTPISE